MDKTIAQAALDVGIGHLHRHILLCVAGKECCTEEVSLQSWDFLKKRLAELGLAGRDGYVYRSRVQCLRICQQGPSRWSTPKAPGTGTAPLRTLSASSRNISSAAGW